MQKSRGTLFASSGLRKSSKKQAFIASKLRAGEFSRILYNNKKQVDLCPPHHFDNIGYVK
jgi:hypothetical protein